MEYYSAFKKNETMQSAGTRMDLEYHVECSQSDRGEIPYDIPYTRSLKINDTNELTKQRLTDSENELTVGGGEEGIGGDFGTDMYTLLYLKWISIKDLLYGTGNSAQYSITT